MDITSFKPVYQGVSGRYLLRVTLSNEQIEKASTDKIARQLEMIADNKQGIFLCDRELAIRVFIQGSPLDSVAYRQAT
jgi:hypothetical protein